MLAYTGTTLTASDILTITHTIDFTGSMQGWWAERQRQEVLRWKRRYAELGNLLILEQARASGYQGA